jgi:hypothetical protein
MAYQDWKATVLGTVIGDGQCVSLVVNNSRAYVEALYPGVSWPTIIAPVVGAKDMAGKTNSYLTWIANDHNDPNQVPLQGDIMVFDATPQAGYTNTYNNPYGHTGICDSTDATGFSLLQQNAPAAGAAANVTHYSWKFRPCLGWLRPNTNNPAPSPTPAPAGHTITLPATTGPWHLYNVGGPYNPAAAKGLLWPSKFSGLTYDIVENKGNGIYVINSQDFGQGALWTNGSYVIIN